MIDKWSVAHRYNKLAQAGLASPLTNPEGVVYILRANKQFEPCWWDPSNDSYMQPGLLFWNNLKDAVDEADIANFSIETALL